MASLESIVRAVTQRENGHVLEDIRTEDRQGISLRRISSPSATKKIQVSVYADVRLGMRMQAPAYLRSTGTQCPHWNSHNRKSYRF